MGWLFKDDPGSRPVRGTTRDGKGPAPKKNSWLFSDPDPDGGDYRFKGKREEFGRKGNVDYHKSSPWWWPFG